MRQFTTTPGLPISRYLPESTTLQMQALRFAMHCLSLIMLFATILRNGVTQIYGMPTLNIMTSSYFPLDLRIAKKYSIHVMPLHGM
jgi:predicted RND superfamily exporter protein